MKVRMTEREGPIPSGTDVAKTQHIKLQTLPRPLLPYLHPTDSHSFDMFLSTLFLLGGSALVAAVPYAANQTRESCNYLARFYPDAVFFPGSTRYTFEDTCKSYSTPRFQPLLTVS